MILTPTVSGSNDSHKVVFPKFLPKASILFCIILKVADLPAIPVVLLPFNTIVFSVTVSLLPANSIP